MTHPTESAHPEDAILGQFLNEYEHSAEPEAVVVRWSERHPDLADQIAAFADMNRHLRDANAPESVPVRQLARSDRLGDFIIERLLAVGGMGEIYEARQVGLERHVALKVIRRDRAAP